MRAQETFRYCSGDLLFRQPSTLDFPVGNVSPAAGSLGCTELRNLFVPAEMWTGSRIQDVLPLFPTLN